MTLPLLSYPATSSNHRVSGFEIGNEEKSGFHYTRVSGDDNLSTIIDAAYRQIINEQQMLSVNRDRFLESQLRSNSITVREFVRGLLLSETFRRRNYDCSNNYRFVQMCIQRVLGRDVYDDREKLAWSIVLATKGIQGFVDDLINSDEYLENFGDDTVPYQRRRIIPQRTTGDVTFAHMPRYGADHLATLEALGNDYSRVTGAGYFDGDGMPSEELQKVAGLITKACAVVLSTALLGVILSWFGWFHI